jgi:hypothetical protein
MMASKSFGSLIDRLYRNLKDWVTVNKFEDRILSSPEKFP